MTDEEILETTRIHSCARWSGDAAGFKPMFSRPFRTPHHSASMVALVGGGSRLLPGEASLAHNGVLFLDELPEFNRCVLEALREPMEEGSITVSRASGSVLWPARFMMGAAMNPCPCGNRGSRTKACTCTPSQIQRYARRISGPLLDRIDLFIERNDAPFEDLKGTAAGEPSASIRQRVMAARQREFDRFGDSTRTNARMNIQEIEAYCPLNSGCQAMMERAFRRMNLSARAYQRLRKVARTIADLEGSADIQEKHLAEAIRYRSLSILGGIDL